MQLRQEASLGWPAVEQTLIIFHEHIEVALSEPKFGHSTSLPALLLAAPVSVTCWTPLVATEATLQIQDFSHSLDSKAHQCSAACLETTSALKKLSYLSYKSSQPLEMGPTHSKQHIIDKLSIYTGRSPEQSYPQCTNLHHQVY